MECRAWTALICSRTGTGGGLLCILWWIFGFHKMLGVSWAAEDLLASQEGLYSVQLGILDAFSGPEAADPQRNVAPVICLLTEPTLPSPQKWIRLVQDPKKVDLLHQLSTDRSLGCVLQGCFNRNPLHSPTTPSEINSQTWYWTYLTHLICYYF